jgi:hypothetical protein
VELLFTFALPAIDNIKEQGFVIKSI